VRSLPLGHDEACSFKPAQRRINSPARQPGYRHDVEAIEVPVLGRLQNQRHRVGQITLPHQLTPLVICFSGPLDVYTYKYLHSILSSENLEFASNTWGLLSLTR